MNAILKAAKILKNNWCVGDLHEVQEEGGKLVDKFCAVGALAQTTDTVTLGDPVHQDDGTVVVYWDETATYDAVEKTPELKALALGVLDTEWWKLQNDSNYKDRLGEVAQAGTAEDKPGYSLAEVLYFFNDAQEDNGPVVELFNTVGKNFK